MKRLFMFDYCLEHELLTLLFVVKAQFEDLNAEKGYDSVCIEIRFRIAERIRLSQAH